ncbi:uncharacterized protein M6B38_113125 [Iris pallida]|uniref:Uncharacterized protein n=1 Tax=Iris pallida TaxID=29817 RepID=A0AAX6IKJ0_IRIPA|nr:uncharacterized protein M6B38_113125 [Iris pallida]
MNYLFEYVCPVPSILITILVDYFVLVLVEQTDECAALLQKQKVINSFSSEFGLVKRFWGYLLEHLSLDGDLLWASISSSTCYEGNDDIGRLECGHSYHICCSSGFCRRMLAPSELLVL